MPGRQNTGTPEIDCSKHGASPTGLPSTRAPAGTRTWRSWIAAPTFDGARPGKNASMRWRAASSTTGQRRRGARPRRPSDRPRSGRARPSKSRRRRARPPSQRGGDILASSQQLVIHRVVMSRSHRRWARYDEFVSTISPRHSSSPIVKISARIAVDTLPRSRALRLTSHRSASYDFGGLRGT